MKKQIIGYTAGVYDMFHIGHLNLLKNAKAMCDILIVGVTSDELASYKDVKPTIPLEDRLEIVRSIRYVDVAIVQNDLNKVSACKKLKVSRLFVGDDWYDSPRWNEYEKKLQKIGVDVIYFPYTKKISSSKLREFIGGGDR